MANVQVQIGFYDAAGTVVKAESESIAFMLPGEQTAVGGSSFTETGQPVEMRVQVRATEWSEWGATRSTTPFTFQSINLAPQEYGGLKVTGEVVSPFTVDMETVRLNAVYRNAAGAITGGAFTFQDFIPASSTSAFEITSFEDVPATGAEVYGQVSLLKPRCARLEPHEERGVLVILARMLTVLAALVCALAIMACGGGGGGEDAEVETATATQKPTARVTKTPDSGIAELTFLTKGVGWSEALTPILNKVQLVTDGQFNSNYDPAAAAFDIEDLRADIVDTKPPPNYEEVHDLWLRLVDELEAMVEANRLGDSAAENLHGENILELYERIPQALEEAD